jgi:single-strand DNA-binding protein
MSQGEIPIYIVGSLTAAPELRFTQSGAAVAGFTVATNPRKYNSQTQQWEDGDATFVRCTVWRQAAENIAQLDKGTRVMVNGRLQQRSYDTREGEKRTVLEVQVDEWGASGKFHPVTVQRPDRSGGQQQPQQSRRQAGPEDDPWAASPSRPALNGGFTDEPPF